MTRRQMHKRRDLQDYVGARVIVEAFLIEGVWHPVIIELPQLPIPQLFAWFNTTHLRCRDSSGQRFFAKLKGQPA